MGAWVSEDLHQARPGVRGEGRPLAPFWSGMVVVSYVLWGSRSEPSGAVVLGAQREWGAWALAAASDSVDRGLRGDTF